MEPESLRPADEVDEKEQRLVTQMRAAVEDQDPAAKEEDDLMLRRFLRARDLDVKKASVFFLKYLQWRREAIPKGFISESEVQDELNQRKAFAQGYDKMGRPIAVFIGGRHIPYNRDIEEFKRFGVYVIEKLCSRMRAGQEKFVVISDFKGWGYSNLDIKGSLVALDILQNNYPERLAKSFLVNVPYIFMKAWDIVYPFIDETSRRKYVFVEDNKIKETLLEYIDESQLPEPYGGKLKLVPINE